MFKTRISVSIARTREDVFDYVTDPANDGPVARLLSGLPLGIGRSTWSGLNPELGEQVLGTQNQVHP